MIKTLDLTKGENANLYQYLSSSITPRPIALVSTIDKLGRKNLAPFSFFNVFSISPPILVFSPAKNSRLLKNKDTLENILQVKECVIALVTESMAQQVSLASCNYKDEVNEFDKAGFTEVKSEIVTPVRVKESPVNFECKINKVIKLGEDGGAGNLVIAEILKIHLHVSILDKDEQINPFKLNIISRYGGDWYGKTTKDSLYQIEKPLSRLGMGIDKLPLEIKNSEILSGNELAILASAENLPEKKEFLLRNNKSLKEKHILAKEFLQNNKPDEAWQILL